MKIVIVQKEQTLSPCLAEIIQKESIQVQWYHSPLVAIGEFKKELPLIICWNAVDFPHHWQLLMGYLMGGKKRLYLALITDTELQHEKGAESLILGVSQVIPISLDLDEQRELWYQFFEKTPLQIARDLMEEVPEQEDEPIMIETAPELEKWVSRVGYEVTIVHPENGKLLRGEFDSISQDGILFYPKQPIEAMDIEHGAVVDASFFDKIRSREIGFRARVIDNNLTITLLPIVHKRSNP